MHLTEPLPRKKQPERVRRALLDCAAQLSVQDGLAGITVQAVAHAAGVTKGGLFHHFPTKQALIEAMFDDMLAHLDHKIESFLIIDTEEYGRFTRAYLNAVFAEPNEDNPWGNALPISVIVEEGLKHRWDAWLAARLARHAQTDTAQILKVVRLAADGIWFDCLLGRKRITIHLHDLRDYLLKMTQASAAAALDA